MHEKALLPFLLLFGLASACAVVAAGVTGFVVSQEFMDNAMEVYMPGTSRVVWPTTKATLSEMSATPIDVDDDLMAAEATIDAAKVVVQVETFNQEETRVRILARKFGVDNKALAEMVQDRIRRNLDR